MYPTRLDAGPWFTVGKQLDGSEAFERVSRFRRTPAGARRPYCVYVHVPFCRSICSFCALYTFGVGPDADHRFDEYVDMVLRSLPSNPWYGAQRPPTTVHFGGGTPLVLGNERFTRLVRALVEAFGTSPACEWAVETTTSSLDPPTVATLAALGFQRIHLGVQTLDDTTRQRVGRRGPGAATLERIVDLHARGFLTSVDLIIGLDGVDRSIFERDLQRLYAAGVRMFSICELRERRPAAFAASRRDPDRARRNFDLWRTAWDFMADVELIPIHGGQFARSQKDNLYFTHPARREDCVAIGPYAHGSADRISYGNHLLREYYRAVRSASPPMAMGVDYGAGEQVVCDLERELLAHHISDSVLGEVLGTYRDHFAALLDSWLTDGLLCEGAGGCGLDLTASGSWFVGNMVIHARSMAETTRSSLALSRLPR
ncbi:MAG: radical SAM protein [Holophagales bacterium]|nr:radical SAM protein [Holophagales bacterium]